MLKEKNVVVTGCLQGIGKETVKIFAENGANILACAYKQDDAFEEYCRLLTEDHKVRVEPIYFDMMDNTAIKAAARTIQRLKIEIHGLVNIAGINRDAYFNMITEQDMHDTFQVNFFSQMIFTQYIVKIMQRYKTAGSIVFTSSVTAFDGNAGQVCYGASKAALVGAMKSMALELGAAGIRVNVIAPGVIDTPMTRSLSDEIIDDRIKKMDIPHLGETEDVANMFMYLISDLSTHVTGQTIRVDGGMR